MGRPTRNLESRCVYGQAPQFYRATLPDGRKRYGHMSDRTHIVGRDASEKTR